MTDFFEGLGDVHDKNVRLTLLWKPICGLIHKIKLAVTQQVLSKVSFQAEGIVSSVTSFIALTL